MDYSPVFVNRLLNMKKIKAIGFDMDHTLIRYHTERLETLVYTLVVKKLIEHRGYPSIINTLTFHFNEVIRGLIVDSVNGNILKLSRFSAIRQSYHGTHEIDFEEQKKIYQSVYVDLKDSNYIAIDTSFSIAFCALYGQLVDLKDNGLEELPDYRTLALDVIAMVDEVHSDGSLKGTISKELEHYIVKDDALVDGLKKYAASGKQLFLLTNSSFAYTKVLLDFALNPYLKKGESWENIFSYVITLAHKPRFFFDNLPFLRVDSTTGLMANVSGPVTPGIYQGGNARDFTNHLGLFGDDILYIGDHIYGDILRLKKDCNWRTALVVEELGNEIASERLALPLEDKISALMTEKIALQHKLLIQDDPLSYPLITEIDKKLSLLLRQEQVLFNPHWGRVFRVGMEETYFAYQVERFACIYMEKLTDLLTLSPHSYFRTQKRKLPHENIF